jgi:hypothetical protein
MEANGELTGWLSGNWADFPLLFFAFSLVQLDEFA